MQLPLVSIIVPTRNSALFIENCLKSIKAQSYQHIEILVIDGNSHDQTKKLALKYTDKVYNFPKLGDFRSSQRNMGAKKAQGEYFLFIDSDMELAENLVEKCIEKIYSDPQIKGLKIPEESFGQGLWAKCKRLEKSMYLNVDWMEAVRFMAKNNFFYVKGYNEQMISGEDYDLSYKLEKLGKIDRINTSIFHNEGNISLLKTITKKFYYAKHHLRYINKYKKFNQTKNQINIFNRYLLFFKQPQKLFKNPMIGISMLFMKTCELGFGGLGYLYYKLRK